MAWTYLTSWLEASPDLVVGVFPAWQSFGGMGVQELLDLNRYIHDFTAAMWVCGSILIWLLCREGMPSNLPAESGLLLRRLARKITLISVPSLVVSLASGVVRAVTFKTYEHPGEITTSLVTILVVKHALFTAFVVWGVAVHVRSRGLGKTAHTQ